MFEFYYLFWESILINLTKSEHSSWSCSVFSVLFYISPPLKIDLKCFIWSETWQKWRTRWWCSWQTWFWSTQLVIQSQHHNYHWLLTRTLSMIHLKGSTNNYRMTVEIAQWRICHIITSKLTRSLSDLTILLLYILWSYFD